MKTPAGRRPARASARCSCSSASTSALGVRAGRCSSASLAGVAATVAQVGLKPTPAAIKPDFKKLNPIVGPRRTCSARSTAPSRRVKNVAKVGVVGAIAAMAVFPKLDELAALVGTPPRELLPQLAGIDHDDRPARRGRLPRRSPPPTTSARSTSYEKALKMDKEEIKQEFKQQEPSCRNQVSAAPPGNGARPARA